MKLYVEEETKEFFHKYKAPLLSLFLNDPDIDLSLKWKNSFILGNEYLINKISDVNKIPRIASSDLLPKLSSSYRKYSAQSASGMRFEPNYLSNIYIYPEELISLCAGESDGLKYLSYANGIQWSEDILDKYIDKWDWYGLCQNNSLLWNEYLIEKYKELIDFEALSYNTGLQLTTKIIERYESKWDWNGISGNPVIAGSLEEYILSHPKVVFKQRERTPKSDKYQKYDWFENLNEHYTNWFLSIPSSNILKPSISSNPGICWSLSKFEQYREKLDVWVMGLFSKLNLDIIYKYYNDLNLSRYCYTVFHRHSDYEREPCDYYISFWENFFINSNTRITYDFYRKFLYHDITYITKKGRSEERRVGKRV